MTRPTDAEHGSSQTAGHGPHPAEYQVDSPLEAALAAFAPAIRRPDLTGAQISYLLEETAIGRLLLAARSDGAVLASRFAPDDAHCDAVLDRLARLVSPSVLRGGRVLDDVRRQLEDYLAGRRRTFDLRFDLALASPFQRIVLDRLAESVGYGSTTSYGRLAADIGQPSASRAVGTALGANPLCVLVPCHRVVAASGALTGYAGGTEAKRLLLELEARSTPRSTPAPA
jgi:methylated-DNA-[protein]-cysteine S-methyltransferase